MQTPNNTHSAEGNEHETVESNISKSYLLGQLGADSDHSDLQATLNERSYCLAGTVYPKQDRPMLAQAFSGRLVKRVKTTRSS